MALTLHQDQHPALCALQTLMELLMGLQASQPAPPALQEPQVTVVLPLVRAVLDTTQMDLAAQACNAQLALSALIKT